MLVLVGAIAHAQGIDRVELMNGPAREQPIRRIILHATGGPSCDPAISHRSGTLDGIVTYFLEREDGLSVHYVIGRDGTVVSMVPEEQVASHAFRSNLDSIGIELVNRGDGLDLFAPEQIEAVTELLGGLMRRHRLPPGSVTTHDAVDSRWFLCDGLRGREVSAETPNARKRNPDPGDAFPLDAVVAAASHRAQQRASASAPAP